jgi:hypothetical protein
MAIRGDRNCHGGELDHGSYLSNSSGLLVDSVRAKRLLVLISGLLVGLRMSTGCLRPKSRHRCHRTGHFRRRFGG